MARPLTIVSIGEALLCEYPNRIEPGGLAIRAAQAAQRLGHRGIPVSRLGQDQSANELLTQLRGQSITIDHLQSDPDLPTGRLVVRSMGGQSRRTLTPRAAFDNLQWDFDLVDLAQHADAVVFGAVAQRDGQSQSVIRQLLTQCHGSLRVFDATNRLGNEIERGMLRGSLHHSDLAVLDAVVMRAVVPGWNPTDARQAALQLMQAHGLTHILALDRRDCQEMLSLHAREGSATAAQPVHEAQHVAAVIAIVHGLHHEWTPARVLEVACRATNFIAQHPEGPVPPEVLNDE